MKRTKLVFAVLLAFVAVLAVVGMLLPRDVRVERSITINAPTAEIYPAISNLRTFTDWSPWAKYDPNMQNTFSGPDEGTGAKMEWSSDDASLGKGSMEIVGTAEDRIDIALEFDDMAAQSYWEFAEIETGTRVTWGVDTDMGAGPVGRWMGLMMDNWIGPDYEEGLANLKAFVEAE